MAGVEFALFTSLTVTVPGAPAFNVLVSVLAIEDFLDLLTALRSNLLRRAHHLEALDRGAHQVDGVTRADGLREHVLHADHFEHRAHRAAGDHAGTFRSRLHVDARGAVVRLDGV